MATFSGACAVELQRLRPGMTREAFDQALLTLGEEPEDFRTRGFPCLAAYTTAFYAERPGEPAPTNNAGPLLVGGVVVGVLYFMSRRRSGGLRGLRRRRRR